MHCDVGLPIVILIGEHRWSARCTPSSKGNNNICFVQTQHFYLWLHNVVMESSTFGPLPYLFSVLPANHNAQGKINKKSDGNFKLRLRLYLFGLLPLFLLFSLLHFTFPFFYKHTHIYLFSLKWLLGERSTWLIGWTTTTRSSILPFFRNKMQEVVWSLLL